MLAEARLNHEAADDGCTAEAVVARIAASYDRAVAVAPEASVAAYTSGPDH